MEERQATIDGVTHTMPDPFLVIATQNPIEYEGTSALPEAQLDRFMLIIRLGYPQPIEEIVILDEQKRTHPLEELDEVLGVRCAGCSQPCARSTSTRPSPTTSCASSTRRGAIRTSISAPRRAGRSRLPRGPGPCRPARTSAFIPDDIKVFAEAALAHRSGSSRRARRSTMSRRPRSCARSSTARHRRHPADGRRSDRDPADDAGRQDRPERLAPAVTLRSWATDVPTTPGDRSGDDPRGRRVLDRLRPVLPAVSRHPGDRRVLRPQRLCLSDLEAGCVVSQLHGHVGDRMRVTYTLRNSSRLLKPARSTTRRPCRAGCRDAPSHSAAMPSGRGRSAHR